MRARSLYIRGRKEVYHLLKGILNPILPPRPDTDFTFRNGKMTQLLNVVALSQTVFPLNELLLVYYYSMLHYNSLLASCYHMIYWIPLTFIP